jgi:hypothetical protein
MNPAAPSGYYLVIGISEGGLDQGDIENEGIGEYTGYGFAFAEGFVNGAGAWSSALSRIWRWSDNPESRSLASQLIKTAGPEAAALESVSKYAGLAGIAFEGVINVAQEGVLKGTVNTGFEVAGAATGAVLGSAICATETVATAGWGAIACPLIVGSLSAGFSYLGDKAFGAVNSVDCSLWFGDIDSNLELLDTRDWSSSQPHSYMVLAHQVRHPKCSCQRRSCRWRWYDCRFYRVICWWAHGAYSATSCRYRDIGRVFDDLASDDNDHVVQLAEAVGTTSLQERQRINSSSVRRT